MTVTVSPDEQVFRLHLEQGPFLNGVDHGYWRLVDLDWPQVVIAVSAAPRDKAPEEFAFRFTCDNYPQVPPTAQPWDAEQGTPLAQDQWPAGQSRVPAAFRPDWQQGRCLYLPCDRLSIQGHGNWRTQYPSMLWLPDGDITQYLKVIHELLNSSDYTGIRSP